MNSETRRFDPAANDTDRVRIVAYLDGKLAADDARAFEVRLGREPELARAFEELAEVDEDLRRSLGGSGSSMGKDASHERASRRWVPRLAVAAGLALTLGALGWILAREPSRSEGFVLDVALVETAPSDADFNELLGFDPEWLPLGMGYRDAGGEPAPDADAYAAALDAAFRARTDSALATEALSRAESFVLALRPEAPCYVVLVVAYEDPDQGAEARDTRRVYPVGSESLSLIPGETYLLPGDPLHLPDDWRTSQRVDYEPGILTRRGVDVTLAVRSDPVPPELLDELDALIVHTTTEGWFADHGFRVRSFRIEPREDG